MWFFSHQSPQNHSRVSVLHVHLPMALTIILVVAAKDFRGLAESSHLSRAFSDQGVRLRLRKEPRGLMG